MVGIVRELCQQMREEAPLNNSILSEIFIPVRAISVLFLSHTAERMLRWNL